MIAGLKSYPEYKDSGLSWLGRVPDHWAIKRGKSYMTSIDVRSRDGREELLTVSSGRGVVPRSTAKVTMFKAESYAGYKLCWPGDLVINSLWAWGGGLGVARHHGIISTAYSVYRHRPAAQINPQYLHELVRSAAFNWELHVRSKGIWISRLQLTDTSFLDAPIPLPPPEEQAAIVRFLDHANRKIDGFIRAKRKLIGLLNEQKQAIIHRAVTRGLDPDVPMKPSGLDWLGDIPAHWEIVRSNRIFSLSKELARPDDVQLSATQAYGVIPQVEYEELIGRKIVKINMHLEKRKHVEMDDFVISMRSFQGGLERAWSSGAIRSSYVILRPSNVVGVEYFQYLLKSPNYISALQATGDFIRDGQDLTFDDFRKVDLPLPPLNEQHEIGRTITESLGNIKATLERTEREISLMQEYRTRLTADVVTGKLDVREAAAQLPDEVPESLDSEDDPDLAEEEESELEEMES